MAQMAQVPFGNTRVCRLVPQLPAQAFKSYGVRYPLATHWRDATCQEVECPAYRLGWDSVVDVSTELGQAQFDYLFHDKSRSFTTEKVGGTLVRFHYPPGNTPFKGPEHAHRVKADRPPLMVVTGGDWRGNPRGDATVVHKNAEEWADDFSTHQDRLARAQN